MGAQLTPDGRPYLWRVSANEPGRIARTTVFLARHVEWLSGGLMMTTAMVDDGDPNQPVDRMVIVPLPGTVFLLDYIGPEDER